MTLRGLLYVCTMSQSAGPNDVWVFSARDESDTERLGVAFGQALKQGGIVALIGTLGAGKTRLVQSIAATLGADRRLVNSPTFILIQEYAAPLPIFHCDTYRLQSVEEFLDLGIDEMFESQGVCLIEWADRVAAVLPPDHLEVAIEVVGPTERTFRIRGTGDKSTSVLESARSGIKSSTT